MVSAGPQWLSTSHNAGPLLTVQEGTTGMVDRGGFYTALCQTRFESALLAPFRTVEPNLKDIT